MTGTAPNPESLRHSVQVERGYWDPEQAALAELAPGFLDAWARLATVPVRKNHLGAKDRALIALSAATAATHLYAPGTRRQIRNALKPLRQGRARARQRLKVVPPVSC